jgi:hypothetical protein
MLQNKFTPQELLDSLGPMPGGMNADLAPLILPKDQLSFAVNVTTRRSYVHPRPPFQIRKIDAAGNALLATAFAAGAYQGGGYYNPDVGPEVMLASIAGRIFQFNITLTPVTVQEISIPGDLNSSTEEQVWMWQSEKWMIITDGTTNNPIFYDGTTSVRSNYNSPVNFSTTLTTAFVVPNVGAVVTGVVLASNANIVVGDILTFKNYGTFLVQATSGGTLVDLVNLTAQAAQTIPSTTAVAWAHLGDELPPGRMGAYGMGRNWMCLIDGKQFVASDITGGSSGTAAENYRDAVLHITENNFLAGGGNFSVPGSIGDIRAMIFAATLDSSLGQGPLQIFTHSNVFSCQAPVDRLTWQDVTNPILTQSLISNGALGQWSTIVANSDILFRSIDGIRSLILARRDFNTWGNVPQSAEVDPILSQDSTDLLRFGSGMVWDNRMLMTARPTPSDMGFYHSTIIALDFDPISSLRGKLPSVYDGPWTGLNILQMITGEFEEVPRAFSFCVNLDTNELEIYEFLTAETPKKDNGTRDILMDIQSASLFRYPDEDPKSRDLKRLADGEIYVDQIPPDTTANFQVYYKPDQWPCWVPWFQWSECAGPGSSEQKPQFRPRMGLGEPSPIPCDETNNRPLRLGYTFQVRVIFSNCRFLGARFRSVTVPQQEFAKQVCLPLCPAT